MQRKCETEIITDNENEFPSLSIPKLIFFSVRQEVMKQEL